MDPVNRRMTIRPRPTEASQNATTTSSNNLIRRARASIATTALQASKNIPTSKSRNIPQNSEFRGISVTSRSTRLSTGGAIMGHPNFHIPSTSSNEVTAISQRPSPRASVVKPKTSEADGTGIRKKSQVLKRKQPLKEVSAKCIKENIKRMSVSVQTDARYTMAKAKGWTLFNDSLLPGLSCPICFGSYGPFDSKENEVIISIGKCGHCVCMKCSNTIFASNPKCPICQVKLIKADFRKIYLS